MVPGVDVSEHQAHIDGQHLADAGIQHAVVRCADPITRRVDLRYVENTESLRAAGVPCDTYVFARADLETPQAAADRYTGYAHAVEDPGRLWIDVEWEFDGGRSSNGAYHPLIPPDQTARWLRDHLLALEDRGWRGHLGVYTGAGYWDRYIGGEADEVAARLPYWHASYPFSELPPPEHPAEWENWLRGRTPTLARPWRDDGTPYSIWQFTSSGTLLAPRRLDCNLVDPALIHKDKPTSTPEDDVLICVPRWSKAVDSDRLRWQFYSIDGALFSAWNGAPVPADAGFVKNQFLPCVTIDLTTSLAGQRASQPVMLNEGRLAGVYRQDGAPFFWATGEHDPDPVLPDMHVDVAEVLTAARAELKKLL